MTALTFLERLGEDCPILLDGGLGTALIMRGLPPGTPPDRWTLERPFVLTEVHRGYVEAGSDAVHANTFGANPIRLAAFGLELECERINRAAVACARAASPRFVIADVGPTGEYLPPVGRADTARWKVAFELQAKILADTSVDALHIETMTDLREARIALEALLEYAPGIPVLAALTCDRKKRGFFTMMGDPMATSLRILASDGASAVGANCSITSRDMLDLATELLRETGAPVVLQPNAGSPRIDGNGALHYAQDPLEFAAQMSEIAALGVRLVGGCCGTDARFIAALRSELKPGAA